MILHIARLHAYQSSTMLVNHFDHAGDVHAWLFSCQALDQLLTDRCLFLISLGGQPPFYVPAFCSGNWLLACRATNYHLFQFHGYFALLAVMPVGHFDTTRFGYGACSTRSVRVHATRSTVHQKAADACSTIHTHAQSVTKRMCSQAALYRSHTCSLVSYQDHDKKSDGSDGFLEEP